jgi:hypothetical protein
MKILKTVIKFLQLFFYYGDIREAWQDAKFINNKEWRRYSQELEDEHLRK